MRSFMYRDCKVSLFVKSYAHTLRDGGRRIYDGVVSFPSGNAKAHTIRGLPREQMVSACKTFVDQAMGSVGDYDA